MKLLYALIPKSIRNLRHLFYAWWGARRFNQPANELLVIGVTGTSGKSSTIYFLRQLLESAGLIVGALSTIEFVVASQIKLNDKKMTMLGKMEIQKYLRAMVDAHCDVALIETTSEGAVQYRHRFVNYDIILVTNFYPEHLESHGSFENYKQAKLDILQYVADSKRKKIKNPRLWSKKKYFPKTAIVNGQSQFVDEFLSFPFDKKVKVLCNQANATADCLSFSYLGLHYKAKLPGKHNIQNVALSVATALQLGIPEASVQVATNRLSAPPGRIEFISEAEAFGFRLIVDYAFEPKAIAALYEVVKQLKPKKIIHVFGSTGGGRDVQRRFTVGQLVGKQADICIITDEDPYDDDPMSIINDVTSAVEKTGKILGQTLFKILSRSEAIQKAITFAQAGDVVLITGKGSEQRMVVKGKMIPWDDREIARAKLTDRGYEK